MTFLQRKHMINEHMNLIRHHWSVEKRKPKPLWILFTTEDRSPQGQQKLTRVGEDVEKQEAPDAAGGNVDTSGSSSKSETHQWPRNPALLLLGAYPGEIKTRPHRNLARQARRSIIHDSQKVETQKSPPQMNRKTNHVHTHRGTPLSHKKKGGTDRCYDVDGHRQHHAAGKKPNTEGHTVHDPLYRTQPDRANPQTQSRLQVARNGRKGEPEVVMTRVQTVLRGEAKVVKLDRGNGCTTLWIYWTPLVNSYLYVM